MDPTSRQTSAQTPLTFKSAGGPMPMCVPEPPGKEACFLRGRFVVFKVGPGATEAGSRRLSASAPGINFRGAVTARGSPKRARMQLHPATRIRLGNESAEELGPACVRGVTPTTTAGEITEEANNPAHSVTCLSRVCGGLSRRSVKRSSEGLRAPGLTRALTRHHILGVPRACLLPGDSLVMLMVRQPSLVF